MPRPVQDHQVRIDEILDVAEPLFNTKGYRKTTVSDIARKLGVAQGMLYYYFKSKGEIAEAILLRKLSFFMTKIEKEIYCDIHSAGKKLEYMINIIIQFIDQNPRGLFQNMFREEEMLLIQKRIFNRGIVSLKPHLLKIIAEGNQMGSFHTTHPNIAISFFFSTLTCLCDALFEENRDDLSSRLRMTECLIEKLFGMTENTICLSL